MVTTAACDSENSSNSSRRRSNRAKKANQRADNGATSTKSTAKAREFIDAKSYSTITTITGQRATTQSCVNSSETKRQKSNHEACFTNLQSGFPTRRRFRACPAGRARPRRYGSRRGSGRASTPAQKHRRRMRKHEGTRQARIEQELSRSEKMANRGGNSKAAYDTNNSKNDVHF